MADSETGSAAPRPDGLSPQRALQPRSSGLFKRIAARLPTYIANIAADPRWFALFVLGRVVAVRRLLWQLGPTPIQATETLSQSFFRDWSEQEAQSALRTLHEQGVIRLPDLPPAQVDEIRSFAERTPCFGNFDRTLAFLPGEHAAAERRFGLPLLVGHYFEALEHCSAIRALCADPLLHYIANAYLRGNAKVISTRLWWSFPTEPTEADLHQASQEFFHFDLDDWRAVKFFFYLCDVGEEAGPHVYVKTSHSRHTLAQQLSLTVGRPDHEIFATYGADNCLILTGTAGTSFVEDPFGFHKGTLARKAARLVLEIQFGVSAALGERFYGELRLPPAQGEPAPS